MELIRDGPRKNTHRFLHCANRQGGFVPLECLDLSNLASQHITATPRWLESRYRLEEEEGKEPKLLRLVCCSG